MTILHLFQGTGLFNDNRDDDDGFPFDKLRTGEAHQPWKNQYYRKQMLMKQTRSADGFVRLQESDLPIIWATPESHYCTMSREFSFLTIEGRVCIENKNIKNTLKIIGA